MCSQVEQNAEVVAVGLCFGSGPVFTDPALTKLSFAVAVVRFSNTGSLVTTQTMANPVGWQNPSKVPPQLQFGLSLSGNGKGQFESELMAQRRKAPRAARGMAFHGAVPHTVFGLAQGARPPLS